MKKTDPIALVQPNAQEAEALQRVYAGEATPAQQKAALDFILFGICRMRDLSYRPDSDRNTAFAEGKRFVGLEIARVLNMAIGDFDKEDNV